MFLFDHQFNAHSLFYVHKLKALQLCIIHISIDIISSKQLVILGCTVDLSVLSQISGESV